MPDLSWDFSFLEKFRYPPLAALCGLLVGLGFGGWGAWTALSAVHEREVNDLHRQVAALEAAKTTNEAETARLREQLRELSPQRREAEAQRRIELETFIQRVDKEIDMKKKELFAALPKRRAQAIYIRNCLPDDAQCNAQSAAPAKPPEPPEKSVFVIQIEKELDALVAQRAEARTRFIALVAP